MPKLKLPSAKEYLRQWEERRAYRSEFDKRRREKYFRRTRAELAWARFPCDCHDSCDESYFRAHIEGEQ